ncbi:hypothetical protein CY34DRAFT_802570 [Suillus luteus UH-Slu-Lm8-n1]|uniref:Uncharacterized protein n=1 Tax=Suillus luteus UH-Slu-Lm8-n1 TaxID=930992 RepID=A0A0D0ASB3_9AGAM|nr:hypothetical protein CY34DRAFT_802570 [Suillus luteus UH-Slu-Lm8-n1]
MQDGYVSFPELPNLPCVDVTAIQRTANATSGKRHLMHPPCSPRQQARISSAVSFHVSRATPMQTHVLQPVDLSLRWVLNMLPRATALMILAASRISRDHDEQVLLLITSLARIPYQSGITFQSLFAPMQLSVLCGILRSIEN